MPITLLETVVASAERRGLLRGDAETTLRITDLFAGMSAVTGKVELVYKGEQEGPQNVAQFLVGRAIKESFNRRFVPNYKPGREQKYSFPRFQPIINWFEEDGRVLDITDDMAEPGYRQALDSVAGLPEVVAETWPEVTGIARYPLMEFVIEGLHQNFLITKMIAGKKIVYTDTVSHMMGQFEED